MRNNHTDFFPIVLGVTLGLLFLFLVALLVKEKEEQTNHEWNTTETFVRYESGKTGCFEGMKHTVDDGFVHLYNRERDISIPESKVTSAQTSQTACNQ